ncbi:transposase [Sphingomonas bacterium]|uniref:transposase n=1 Tax=Sphingomonas bacterium TaxID=1895847 RepID=UPI001576AAC2|nr:transposase [Sphingomonas bacterium]
MLIDEHTPVGALSGSRHGANPGPIRRIEILIGVGRCRSFGVEEKLALLAQMEGCANISELALRHDLRPSQLFIWRRELRYAAKVVQAAVPEPMSCRRWSRPSRSRWGHPCPGSE